MLTFKNLFFLLLLISLFQCQSAGEANGPAEGNPAAEGFNAGASDPEAIAIADEVMEAMGGRDAWDDTRYIAWNFFGARHLLWDKQGQRVRIEVPRDSSIFLVDLENGTGKVKLGDEVVEHPDSLSKYLTQGKNIWINDSYWLVMPFKLKDSGVTLSYVGEDTTQAGIPADVLQLTFDGVGVTPQNRYLVYVDKQDHLVKQWDYFREADSTQANFSLPWADYMDYGGLKLSGNRGERELSDIQVLQEVPDRAFTSFDPVDYEELQ